MGELAMELRELGYEPTDRESPFDESGQLWTNSYELVCDETGIVVRKSSRERNKREDEEEVYRYRNTEKVKLYGGYVSSYEWGDDGGGFSYDTR